MFVEESTWLRDHLASLPLASAARVLDIGSQSLEFRTVRQPWIERNIHSPIRDRGAAIINVDLQDAPGIDVVADVTDPGFDAATVGRFDLVLCCNLLEHVDADLDELHSLPTGSHFSRATYGRLRVVGAASRLARRTLYLDADAVAIGDVAPLTAIALGDGNVIAAVRDRAIPTCSSPSGISDWAERGVDRDAPFFNAGVLLIDNEAWTRDDISSRVIDHLKAAPDAATFADQGTLNAVLHDRWLELPWIWNHQIQRSPAVRIGRLAVSRRSCVSLGKARIMHYFQSVKPWDARYPPGALTVLYRRQWASLLPVPEPPRRTYWQWLRKRY